jgi:hypothetical protein
VEGQNHHLDAHIGCLSSRQSDPGVNELQARDEPWLALPKYKMSNAAKT